MGQNKELKLSIVDEKKENKITLTSRKKKILKLAVFIFLVVILVSIFILSGSVSSEDLVKKIGIRNGYILAFVVSFFAGFSAVTVVSFYGILIAFTSGGLNPVILAIVAGTSLALGDIFLFYFGRKGRDLILGKLDIQINRMANFFRNRKLEKYIALISYLYISFIPLPNDWLLLFLASIRYSKRNMNLIIILGDYTHVCILTFLTAKGILIFA